MGFEGWILTDKKNQNKESATCAPVVVLSNVAASGETPCNLPNEVPVAALHDAYEPQRVYLKLRAEFVS